MRQTCGLELQLEQFRCSSQVEASKLGIDRLSSRSCVRYKKALTSIYLPQIPCSKMNFFVHLELEGELGPTLPKSSHEGFISTSDRKHTAIFNCPASSRTTYAQSSAVLGTMAYQPWGGYRVPSMNPRDASKVTHRRFIRRRMRELLLLSRGALLSSSSRISGACRCI